MHLRSLRVGSALALAALMTTTGLATSTAEADTGGITFAITSLQANDYTIRSGGCHYIPVVATHNAPPAVDDIDVEAEVWNGSKYVSSVSLSEAGPGRLEGSYQYCGYEGRGKFRLGPAEVSWYTWGSDDFRTGRFESNITTTFSVKQASRLSGFKVTKKGKVRTFSVKGTFYYADGSRWASFPKGEKVTLERRSTGGSWKKVKTMKVGKHGKATAKVTTSRAAQYRVRDSATANSWGATSAVKRK
jgi:hypothetical protein